MTASAPKTPAKKTTKATKAPKTPAKKAVKKETAPAPAPTPAPAPAPAPVEEMSQPTIEASMATVLASFTESIQTLSHGCTGLP